MCAGSAGRDPKRAAGTLKMGLQPVVGGGPPCGAGKQACVLSLPSLRPASLFPSLGSDGWAPDIFTLVMLNISKVELDFTLGILWMMTLLLSKLHIFQKVSYKSAFSALCHSEALISSHVHVCLFALAG